MILESDVHRPGVFVHPLESLVSDRNVLPWLGIRDDHKSNSESQRSSLDLITILGTLSSGDRTRSLCPRRVNVSSDWYYRWHRPWDVVLDPAPVLKVSLRIPLPVGIGEVGTVFTPTTWVLPNNSQGGPLLLPPPLFRSQPSPTFVDRVLPNQWQGRSFTEVSPRDVCVRCWTPKLDLPSKFESHKKPQTFDEFNTVLKQVVPKKGSFDVRPIRQNSRDNGDDVLEYRTRQKTDTST